MTALVTGASGHVGGVLVRQLLAKGRDVRCLVHDDRVALETLDVERVAGDVRDRQAVTRAMTGVDVVFHLAAVISIDGDRDGQVAAVNVEGVRNVAESALRAGVRRFVHCCSIHAFEQEPRSQFVDETRARAGGHGVPAYDRSKAAGERAVRELIDAGLDAVIIHPTGVIGPFDFRPSRMGKVFLDLYRRRLTGLVAGGFNWVDVRDLGRALRAAESTGRCGESYIVGGHWCSVKDLARISADVTGVRPPRLVSPIWLARLGAPFVAFANRATGREPLYTSESLRALGGYREISCAKAACDLAFEPRPLEESVRDAYRWFAAQGRLAGAGIDDAGSSAGVSFA